MPKRAIASAMIGLSLAGCIYLPHTTARYDADCEIYERKMTLEAHQVASIAGCRNEGCAALLVAAGAVSAATAVVSGSVVLVGNVVYWLEEKGKCFNRKRNAAPPQQVP